MRPPSLRGFLLCILALWMQLLAPAIASPAPQTVDPFLRICSHAAPTRDVPAHPGQGTAHDHAHCLLCQAVFLSPPMPDRVASVAPVPTATPSPRWGSHLARAPPSFARRRPPPRGPPSFA